MLSEHSDNQLPNDIQIDVLSYISLADLLNFASCSTQSKNITELAHPDFKDVLEGKRLLNTASEKIQKQICAVTVLPRRCGFWKHDPNIYKIKLNKDEKIRLLIALGKGFITVDKLEDVTLDWLKVFCTDPVINAFKNKLVNTSDNISYFTAPLLSLIFSDNGLTGLKENLFTISDLKYFNNTFWLKDILSDDGIIALREVLFTIKELMSKNPFELTEILANAVQEFNLRNAARVNNG